MSSYIISFDEVSHTLNVKFGAPANNSEITLEASRQLDQLKGEGTLYGGFLLKINGPASLPVAFAIAHAVGHLYSAIAVYDPKMSGYVVAISHTPTYRIGQIVE